MSRKVITHNEYLKLLGLVTLAERANKQLKELYQAAVEIVDERDSEGALDDSGHIADVIYGNRDLLEALRILNCSISPPEPAQ